MRIASLRRWHWIVIALVVGLGGGHVRQAATDSEDVLDNYGTLITTQRHFEQALVAQSNGLRQFKDITVYPYTAVTHGGQPKQFQIVAGLWWNGRAEQLGQQNVAHYIPMYYPAAVPYQPLDAANSAATGTVLDYLQRMHQTAGVQFRYAWWWWLVKPMFLWFCGSLVLIGGVWPTVVNLLAFGTFSRSVEEKMPHLAPPPAPMSGPSVQREVNLEKLEHLEHEMERALADGTSAGVPVEQSRPSQAPRRLSSTPGDVVAHVDDRQDVEFGAKPDDYYPTQRRRAQSDQQH